MHCVCESVFVHDVNVFKCMCESVSMCVLIIEGFTFVCESVSLYLCI